MTARWLASIILGLVGLCASAQDLVPVPLLASHVIDQTGTLGAGQQQILDSKLAAFEASHGSQVVVLLVATTQPEDIASFANRVGNTWKIGRRGVGDGLIVIVAKNDRKMRIEVSKSLEGAIPDLAAKRVIDSAMAPAFKQGDYAAGLNAAVDQIIALIKGEALPSPAHRVSGSDGANGFQWQDLAVFVFLAVFVGGAVARRVFGNKLGSLLSGGLVGFLVNLATGSVVIAVIAALVAMVFVLLSSIGRTIKGGRGGFTDFGSGGGWGSGSGGGGFSSGGGGDFGGGGASGDW